MFRLEISKLARTKFPATAASLRCDTYPHYLTTAYLYNSLLLKDLAQLSDFADLEAENLIDGSSDDRMFRKLFYATSVCFDNSGLEWRLKRFARSKLNIIEDEERSHKMLSCAESAYTAYTADSS